MSKTKKIISLVLVAMLVMAMATVAIVSTSAMNADEIHVVAGAPELCGSNWDPADTNNQMTYNAEKDIYEKVFTNVAAGTYEFKVTTNYAWDQGDWNLDGDAKYGGPNAVVTVDADGSTVTVGFNGMNATVEVTGGSDTPVEPPVDEPTDAPVVGGDTVTVYFTNNWMFVDQYVHYWGSASAADTEWPGLAMTFVKTNENGEDIYSAEVPADAAGLVFNGISDQNPDERRQTVDITEYADNAGFYCDSEADGKIAVGTYTYEDTAEPTEAPVVTDAPTDAPVVTDAPTDAPVVTDAPTAEPTEEPTEAPVVGGSGITVAGTEYAVKVGDTITYTVELTAARLFENIQAIVSYDADKLELKLVPSADEDLTDIEYQGETYCENIKDGLIFNPGVAGAVKFNASNVKGYNFKDGKVLIYLDFEVKDASASEIALTIEEMTIKGDGTESYFANGQAVITDGISVVEKLDVPVVDEPTEAPTVEPTQAPTVEPTQAPTVEPTQAPTVEPTQAPTVEPTQAPTVEPTQAPTVKPTDAPVVKPTEAPTVKPTAGVDPTSKTDAPASSTAAGSGAVGTGAAAYIYVVVAVLAMAACAVVVLRKRVNG